MAVWSQYNLQDAASPVMEEFIFFHDFALVILVLILGIVGFIIVAALTNSAIRTNMLEGQVLEGIWTAVPALVLVQIAIPSLLLLYSLDEGSNCELTIKAMGHQWFWTYEYSDFGVRGETVEIESYISPSEERTVRLLDVDNRAPLPIGVGIRVLVGSTDVLHSWAVPAIGVKADACPGRLNQLSLLSHRPGVFYGQCREICGANHRFIPICLELITAEDFLRWLNCAE